jgi:meso-butanediol dehydrogenase/(S,S)-butanediol dehydrogenase/diacetyl reductase
MNWLQGKVAIVTGAARGIGRAMVQALIAEGAHVAASDILEPTGSDMEDLVRTAEQEGVQVLPVRVDVTDSRSVSGMVKKTIDRFGRLHVLINAAGVISISTVSEMDEKEWDRVMGINAKGVFLCCKYALPFLIAGGEGRIINIASVAGKVGRPGYSHYVASKHAVLGFTKSLAYEAAPHNITVNAINPGIVKTFMWEKILAPHFSVQRSLDPETTFDTIIKERVPLGRPQTAEDMAQAAIFLCNSPNITGAALTVDGGYTML